MERGGDQAGDRAGRWQRRERRRQSEWQKLQKHGAGLRQVYVAALRKRLLRLKQRPKPE